MPVLKRRSDLLELQLEGMPAREVKAGPDFVEKCLNDSSFSVRWSAARAFGKSGVGEEALRNRLALEKNELVITEICDSLSAVGRRDSAEAMRPLAIHHKSSLVRSYALMAVADILQKEALPFLTERLAFDPAVRVKATLNVVLLALGMDSALDGIQKRLRSKSEVIRRLVANLLRHYRPRRKRREVVEALEAALQVETGRGARGDFQHAIEELTPARRLGSPSK